ncbi:unnamed protein product, partial [Allacma fusca]
SAYQVEGGYNEGGKGPSTWDHVTHIKPSVILDKSTGDVAADSYHRYREDVVALKKSGVKVYRFSTAWTRILPKGDSSIITAWYEPRDPTNEEDVAASSRALQFQVGWMIQPLLKGVYPPVMRRLLDEKSKAEGRRKSLLPTFSSKWAKIITGTLDYIGLNHYDTFYAYTSEQGNLYSPDSKTVLNFYADTRFDLDHFLLILRMRVGDGYRRTQLNS